MKDEYALLEDHYKDYKLKVALENGETVWYMNGIPIMFGLETEHCHQVDVAELYGDNNDILVAGLGHGNTSEIASEYGKVTTVELLETVFDLYEARVSDEYKHDVLIDDFYDYVNDTSERYDAILMQLDFPGVDNDLQYCLKSNERIYTEEFMTRIKYILNNEGVFVTEGLCKKDEPSTLYDLFVKVGFEVEEYRQPFHLKGYEHLEHILWRCSKEI